MDRVEWLDDWCRKQRQGYQDQLNMMMAGKMRTSESRGISHGMVDTTEETIAIVKDAIARLDAYFVEYGGEFPAPNPEIF